MRASLPLLAAGGARRRLRTHAAPWRLRLVIMPPGCGTILRFSSGMPELPEVEHVRRRLQRAMAGHRITGVETRRDRLRGPLPAGFAARITGQTVGKVRRRAKYLVVELPGGALPIVP